MLQNAPRGVLTKKLLIIELLYPLQYVMKAKNVLDLHL